MHGYSILFIIAFAAFILVRRARSMYKPIKGKGTMMVIAPMFMLTGSFGFLAPGLHYTAAEIFSAMALGLILSVPMIATTHYEVREDGEIYTKKSKAFILSLIGLLVIRLALRDYIQGAGAANLSMLFYLLAVFYVIPWRIASYLKFRRILKEQEELRANPELILSGNEIME